MHARDFDSLLQLTTVGELTGDEQDPVAGHRELQRRVVCAIATLDNLGDDWRHAGMGHQALEAQSRASHGFLIGVTKHHARDDRCADERW